MGWAGGSRPAQGVSTFHARGTIPALCCSELREGGKNGDFSFRGLALGILTLEEHREGKAEQGTAEIEGNDIRNSIPNPSPLQADVQAPRTIQLRGQSSLWGLPHKPQGRRELPGWKCFFNFFFFWAGNSPFLHQERLQVCSEHPHTNTLWGSLQKASRDFWDLQEPARLAADGGGLGAPPELQLELLSPSWLCQGQGQPLAEPSPSRLRRCQGEHKESPKEIWDPCPQIPALNPTGGHTRGGLAGLALLSPLGVTQQSCVLPASFPSLPLCSCHCPKSQPGGFLQPLPPHLGGRKG